MSYFEWNDVLIGGLCAAAIVHVVSRYIFPRRVTISKSKITFMNPNGTVLTMSSIPLCWSNAIDSNEERAALQSLCNEAPEKYPHICTQCYGSDILSTE